MCLSAGEGETTELPPLRCPHMPSAEGTPHALAEVDLEMEGEKAAQSEAAAASAAAASAASRVTATIFAWRISNCLCT